MSDLSKVTYDFEQWYSEVSSEFPSNNPKDTCRYGYSNRQFEVYRLKEKIQELEDKINRFEIQNGNLIANNYKLEAQNKVLNNLLEVALDCEDTLDLLELQILAEKTKKKCEEIEKRGKNE